MPIYAQRIKKKKKSDIPTTQITIITNYSETIISVKQENTSLQLQLENSRLLPYKEQGFDTNRQLEFKVQQLLKNSQQTNTDSELENLINEILKEKGIYIQNFFKYKKENQIFDTFFQTYPFKQKILNLLIKTYYNSEISEQLQYNASLLWLYIMENDSIHLFNSNQLKLPKQLDLDISKEEAIEYFWNMVNIGFNYYTPDNLYIENRGDFNKKFESQIKDKLVITILNYINCGNSQIQQAAAWSLVWLLNTKYEINKSLWKPTNDQLEILFDSFAKSKRVHSIRLLLSIINYSCSQTNAYKGNFAVDCASSLDNNLPTPNLIYEPINEEICKMLYIKYLISSEEIKGLLAQHLANYGFKELSVASRLLTNCMKTKDDDFILFSLLPYISLLSDKSLVSYSTEWLNSDDKLIKFFGLLFQKALEKTTKDILEIITENKHSLESLKQVEVTNSFELQLFEKRKSTALYNVIRLMYRHCHKLTANDTTGRKAWYIVLVTPANEKVFLDAIDGDGTIDLENYGKVVASAYGDKVPDNIDEIIFNKYC
ncbi:hypothetical protein Dfri01_11530 [Dyadobacter frigoris]|nr:hypothetical protein Dfri01_11530 [Dyadobacter frigoris]